jgi:ADP-ribosylglycohydrolase
VTTLVQLDDLVRRATVRAARELERRQDQFASGQISEKPEFHDAFRAGLRGDLGDQVLPVEKKLAIDAWQAGTGTLGAVDVLVGKPEGGFLLLAELKWCWSKKELGWTLWDIFKLVAAQQEYTVDGAYAVVGASDSYWANSAVDCAELFISGEWESKKLFSKYWRAWYDLLQGGTARPSSVPAVIATDLTALEPLATTPAWTIRALRVAAASEKRLPFDGDWPRALARSDQASVGREPARDDRVLGCLLGGAVGDALGAPIEFLSLAEIRDKFGPAGLTTYAPAYGREGAITDDTQMTLFTAEGLMRAHNRHILKGISSVTGVTWWAYQRWLVTQGVEPSAGSPLRTFGRDGWLVDVPELHRRRAPGNTCLSALAGGTQGTIEQPLNDSKGCGGVMRIAPVGLLLPDEAFQLGAEIAALTHGHPAGYLAAGYLASLFSKLLAGQPLWNAAVATLDELKTRANNAECRKAVDAALTAATRTDPSADAVAELGEGWVAEEALAIGLYCALAAGSFEQGVLLAVNHGGDSDSTGAITGNILGAHLGAHAIPSDWRERLELHDVIEALAADLCNHLDDKNWVRGADGWPEIPESEWERYPGW